MGSFYINIGGIVISKFGTNRMFLKLGNCQDDLSKILVRNIYETIASVTHSKAIKIFLNKTVN